VKHISCLLYLAVRVGEGRQLIIVKTEKSGEKEKGFSIFFFLVEQHQAKKNFRIEFQLKNAFWQKLLFGEHSTMKVVSCVRGGVIVYRWPLW